MKNQIKTAEDIKQLGTILSVWAHPDDESFSCAGIMLAAIKNGQKVVCVTATKGEAGVQDETRWPAERLGEIRAQEMQAALKVLGLKTHHWLGYQDGHCHEVPVDEGTAKVRALIDQYHPTTILTFGPEGMTGHTDHQTVSKWVSQATEGTDIQVFHSVEEEERYLNYMIEADRRFNIYFNIDKPPVYPEHNCDIAFILPKTFIDKKCAALQAMPSQTEAMFRQTPHETMCAMLCKECFMRAK
jgi:LmbE family N-acetylglucosaminyl deacetylase